jgi:hypothetical protein
MENILGKTYANRPRKKKQLKGQTNLPFNDTLTLILTAMEFKEPHFEKRK